MSTPFESSTNIMARVVPENPKCHGCLHYETNKSVCLTALMPQTCGSGDDPRHGYAPLSQLKPGDGHPTVGAAQAIGATHDPTPSKLDLGSPPIEVLGDEAPQLAAMLHSAALAHLAKSERNCLVHSFGSMSGTVNPSLSFLDNLHKSDGCSCDVVLTERFITLFYKGLSPRFRFAYTQDAVGALLSSAYKANLEKAGRGPGSRGGKVLYYSKEGRPVYAGQVAHHAVESQHTMDNWHHNAKRSNNPEDHALAARHAHHAAFFHHHNGDPNAAHEAMETAHHHMSAYKKTGHKSKTTKWIKEHHDATKKLVGWSSPEDENLVNPHHQGHKRSRGPAEPKPKHDDTYDAKNYRHGKFVKKPEHEVEAVKAVKKSHGPGFVWTASFVEGIDKILAKSERTPKEIAALNKSMYGDDWLSPFEGTPFFDQAVKLCERDLALDEKQLKRREEQEKKENEAPRVQSDSIWLKRDRIAHEKRKLMLKLAQHRASASKKRQAAFKQLDKIKSFSDPDLIKYVVSSAHQPSMTHGPRGARPSKPLPVGSVTGVKTAQGSNKNTPAQNVLEHVPGKGGKAKDKKKLKKDWYGGQQPAQPRATPQQSASVDNAVRAAGQRAASEAMANKPRQAPAAQPAPVMARKSEPKTFGELFKSKEKPLKKKKKEGKGFIPGMIH